MSGDLERGRELYARREWASAYEALSGADSKEPLGREDLELLAWSAALTGRDDVFLATLERKHQQHVDAGECLPAARAAFWIGLRLFSLGEPGRAGGWLGRAQRLVDREGRECAERGYLLVPLIAKNLASGDNDAAHDTASRAAEIGDRFGDADLSAFARNLQGRALLHRGEVEAGLALLDEAMIAVTSGKLLPLMSGLIYCSVIESCRHVCALDRSREWTAALSDWCEKQPELVTFTGVCLVHRAEIMQLNGDWPAAFEETERACERSTRADALGDAHYQRAEIHRLRGELEAAEESYRLANKFGREPQPGLALLRLAQGRREEAASAIRRVLGTTTAKWERARYLPACVEIMLAGGEQEEAAEASRELEEIAGTFGTEILDAMAAHAAGAVRLSKGDAQGAVEPLRRAFHVWQKIGAPYIAARIRLLLGRACDALGDRDGADLELEAARQVFEELGAAPDLAVIAPEKRAAPKPAHGLTRRELEVLKLVAAGKTNKAIARELFLSERTIDRHVSNIFNKLDVSSRAAATAYAYEHDLL